MNFYQLWEMPLNELTVNQFIRLLVCCFAFMILLYSLYALLKFILNLISYFVRKDKYNFPFFSSVSTLRYIGRLRKQVENAPSEKAYYLYYNQLLGVVLYCENMGYFSRKSTSRFLDVKQNFIK